MSPSTAPLSVHTEPVRPEWIDYNGHLSEAYYVLVLGHATDAVMDGVGLGPAYRDETGASLYTVEAHVCYVDQVGPGEVLEVRSWVVGVSAKLLWIWHELWAGGSLRATEEVLGLHVDATPASAPFPPEVLRLAERARVPPPAEASRAIRVG